MPPSRRGALALTLGAALLSGASAQVCVPDSNAAQGTVNNVPLGGKGPGGSSQNVRTQIRVPAALLPAAGATIDEVSLAGVSTGTYSYTLLEVRLAHLAGTSLATTFEANLADETLVLHRPNASVALLPDLWSPLGLASPFAHDGRRDLIVDVTIQNAFFSGAVPGTRRSSTLETVFALGYSVSNPVPSGSGPFLAGAKMCLRLRPGNVQLVGTGCPQTNGSTVQIPLGAAPSIGTTFVLQAQNARPASAVALLFGRDDRRFGALTLPFDLGAIGAPGCLLRTDVLVVVALPTDATGTARVSIPVPTNQALVGQRALFQVAAPDSVNTLGVVVSALLATTVG